MNFEGTALALLVERFVGYPDALQRLAGHPVEWIGRLVTELEARLNDPAATPRQAQLKGLAALAILLVLTAAIAWLLSALVSPLRGGWVIEALIATSLIAQKSLADHVRQVADALDVSLEQGREAVSRIVGRDPARLDEGGVARAALESLAENSSDGIVAPALCFALLGLPGIALYKAINTADSMIGHKSERFLHFGWAAARLDDLVNLPFSRFTGLLFVAASPGRFREAWEVMRRDAPRHVSPNAGWPEAALAAALGIRLGGPRSYGGRLVDLASMGTGRSALDRTDIRKGLSLYSRAMTLFFLGMLAVAVIS